MKCGSAPSVEILKDATICGSRVTYVVTAMKWDRIAGDVRPSKRYQSKEMPTGIALDTGVIPATRVTGIHTGETGISIHPMQVRD